MSGNTHSWFTGAALALSVLGIGSTIYLANNDTLDKRLVRLEAEHKDDVSELRKKHDEDIGAVRFYIDDMSKGIHMKLDNILHHATSAHIGVNVNASEIDNLKREVSKDD